MKQRFSGMYNRQFDGPPINRPNGTKPPAGFDFTRLLREKF
jgi:hypothetical protein